VAVAAALLTQPSVLMMARAPRPGAVRRALEPLLGPERCAHLQVALIEAAASWANAVAPGALHVAHEPPDAGPELRPLFGPEVDLFPQNGDGISGRLADAAARVFGHSEGPVLVMWPDLPRWRPEHATGALEDLEAGCDVALGPAMDGGFYLIAIARPLPTLFSLPEQAWRSPDVMAIAIAAAQDIGLEIGILRVERALHRPDDVRAALADPLLAPTFAAILGGG
jgi:glycosyltransferase A (GT-A) superfamily protein (DUF2064 family)